MDLLEKMQQQIWNEEHAHPTVLKQMDSREVSSGVSKFVEWVKEKQTLPGLTAIELGCGKGRNVIGLAKFGLIATGLDFSPAAITEAKKRAEESSLSDRTDFLVHDATTPWPFADESFDLAIDCFATTDIETPKGRSFAAQEMIRVLKPGGFLLAYLLSPEDEFHKEMLQASPAEEANAFLHPTTGKFEKTFTREEILNQYQKNEKTRLLKEERVPKTTKFFGTEYRCWHHWMVFEKKITP